MQGQLWDAGLVLIKSKRGRPLGSHRGCRCGKCGTCKNRVAMRLHYYGIKSPRPPRPKREHKPFRGKEGYLHIWLEPDHPLAEMRNKRGTVLHHRFVMATHIGRPLEKYEDVHHKNGDRADNHLANLELWTTDHPRGQRVDDKLDWAIRFIHRHAPDRLANPHG